MKYMCPFCQEFLNRSNNVIEKNRIIAETRTFLIFPTVGGFVDYGMGDTDNAKDDSKKYYAGGLVANLTKDTGDNQAEKASTFTNVVSDVDVTLNGKNNHINKSGGFVGLVSSDFT